MWSCLVSCQDRTNASLTQAKEPQPTVSHRQDSDEYPRNIPLSVSHPLTSPFFVSSGIPFPRGMLRSIQQLRLEDATNRPLVAQFKELGRWPDGSVKVALVTAIVPEGESDYQLRLEETLPPPIRSISCESTQDHIQINTDALTFRIPKEGFSVFDRIQVHGMDVLTGHGDLVLINASDQDIYRSSAFPFPEYTIEECGPVRAIVRAEGSLQSADGKRLTDFIVRLSAYQGQTYVTMDYTLVDTRPERDVTAERPLALEITGYGLALPLKNTRYTFGGGSGARYSGSVTGEHYLYQGGAMRYIDGILHPFEFAYEGVGEGARAAGWVRTDNLTVYVRAFWQQFPKELSVSPDEIRVWLHPPRASKTTQATQVNEYTRPSTFYFRREGGAKTYSLLLQFHPHSSEEPLLGDLFEAAPRWEASAEWYAKSGVFGDLLPAGAATAGYDAYLMNRYYVPSVDCCMSTGSPAVLYGWRDYGDRLYHKWKTVLDGIKIPAFYNDAHVGAHPFFAQYLRTLDTRWWEWAERSTRHWMDIDVSHTSRFGYWDVPQDLGPGEAHLLGHDNVDHETRNLHLGHAHISGLPDYYLLTGNPRALEVIREVGNWWIHMTPFQFPVPIPSPHVAESERDYGWPLYVLNEVYRATGERKYLEASAQIVKHLIAWWQTPSDHYVSGEVIGSNDWTQGSGWWAMYPQQVNSPTPPEGKVLYNGTNPWMAGPLFSALIRFAEYDRDFHLVDPDVLQEMLFQTMNYVVKYGWETSKQWKDHDYFVYSEAIREGRGSGGEGGWHHLLFPLAYLGRLIQEGHPKHPEWYDTSVLWLEISRRAYEDFKVVRDRGTSSTGFYGYETVFPVDFFTLMHALEKD